MRKPSRASGMLAGSAQIAGMLACAGLLSHCGDIQVAGGTSEVGNPSSAIYAGEKHADTAVARVTGFGISATGTPIVVIREKRPPAANADAARTAQDTTGTP